MEIEVRVVAILSALTLAAIWVDRAIAFDTVSHTVMGSVGLIALVASASYMLLQTFAKPLQVLNQRVGTFAEKLANSGGALNDKTPSTHHSPPNERYGVSDLLTQLDSAIAHSTTALAQTLVSKERMERELAVGRQIQMDLLTLTFPSFPKRDNLNLYAVLKPAREMSGDFYDFYFYREGKSYLLEANRLCFCVGDVSGKGVPAALFMAVTKILLKAQADRYSSPSTILSNVNRVVSADNPSCMFVTLFFGVLNLINGELVYTNAGHNAPYLHRQDGSLVHLNARHGPALGVAEEFEYRESKITLNADDMLIIFTDGVTEAMDQAQTVFSEQRLVDVLKSGAYHSAEDVIHLTTEAVSAFQGEAEQADDITMLALKFLGRPEVGEGETWERLIRKEILTSIRE